MAVFISYSHEDSDFAQRLASELVRKKARIWLDKWELRVGDSLLQRIQSAIQTADALIVVLSKASVASEWCKKELNAGLLRELEEKRVIVLPALIEDCEIPLFTREKMYADFRSDFEAGLKATLTAIAPVTSETLGRVALPAANIDYALDWGYVDDRFHLRITSLEPNKDEPHTVLTEVDVSGNDQATRRYEQYEAENLGWLFRDVVIAHIAAIGLENDVRILLINGAPASRKLKVRDEKTGIGYTVEATSRRIGPDNGMDVLFDWGHQVAQILQGQRRAFKKATPDEMKRLQRVLAASHSHKYSNRPGARRIRKRR